MIKNLFHCVTSFRDIPMKKENWFCDTQTKKVNANKKCEQTFFLDGGGGILFRNLART